MIEQRSAATVYVNSADTMIDPKNPFQNPTEEREYTPDYTAVVPQIAIPGCRIPLFPSKRETSAIRRYFTIAGLLLFLNFVVASGIASFCYMLASILLQIVDSAALNGTLPENYAQIATAYLNDSSVMMSANLLGFLIGNVAVFLVGCKLTKLAPMSFFKDQDLRIPTILRYVLLGLFIQFVMGYVAGMIENFFSEAGHPLTSPDFTTGTSQTKLLVTVLYTCFVAPITEELVFRGVFMKNMSRVSQRFGIFVSAFFFALAHENLAQGLLAFFLGILLGYITIKHRSLVPAIIVHFVVNVTSTIFTYLSELSPDSSDKLFALISVIVIILGAIMLLYTCLTERLPDTTPFQSIRCSKAAIGAWGLWAAALLHISMMFFNTIIAKLNETLSF